VSVTDMAGRRGVCDNCNAALGPRDARVAWYRRHQGDLNYSFGSRLARGCASCAEDGYNAEMKSRPFSIRMALGVLNGKVPSKRTS
jgi:hypothetical protein